MGLRWLSAFARNPGGSARLGVTDPAGLGWAGQADWVALEPAGCWPLSSRSILDVPCQVLSGICHFISSSLEPFPVFSVVVLVVIYSNVFYLP